MIDDVIARWHRHLAGELDGGLDSLLDDEVVFVSPVVFTPQRGKALTTAYLSAALVALAGGEGDARFRYTKQVLAEPHAVLEFETVIGGLYVNGVDIITANAEGRIIEFRVMIRPLQAINAVHEVMRAALTGGSGQVGGRP